MLQAIAGYDPKDPRCADEPVPDYSKFIGAPAKGLKIGLIENYFDDLMVSDVRTAFDRALDQLKALGAKVETVPHSSHGADVAGMGLHYPFGKRLRARSLFENAAA